MLGFSDVRINISKVPSEFDQWKTTFRLRLDSKFPPSTVRNVMSYKFDPAVCELFHIHCVFKGQSERKAQDVGAPFVTTGASLRGQNNHITIQV